MSHDTWAHRIARRGIVPPLVRAGVAPNQVTTMRLLVGLSAAACFAAGTPGWRLAGVVLFVVSFILDRADGDLARATGRSSPAGHTYDLVSDTVCNALTFVGLGVGLTSSPLGFWAVPLGLLAGGGVAAVLLLVMRVERLHGARAAELKGIARFDPDDAVLIVPILIALDAAQELLVAAAVGTPVFASFFVIVFQRKLRAAADRDDPPPPSYST
jgi:phosphatidylglycerophosphate synthase